MPTIFDTVSGIVEDKLTTLQSWAQEAINSAQTAVSQIAGINLAPPPTPSVPPVPPAPQPITPPSPPDTPQLAPKDFPDPAEPAITPPTFDAPEPPADATGSPPTINLPPVPSALNAQAPDAPNIDFDVELPARPSLDKPTAPALAAIEPPPAPTITIPAFSGIPPIAPAEPPTNPFSYSDAVYQRTIDVRQTVERMLAGETGLPAAIEQALFDRARVREDVTAVKAVQETIDEWSARGFSMPQGELLRRVDEVRQRNQDAVNTLNRELTIRVHEVKVQELRFAVQQGLAYEGQLIDLHNQRAARTLQAAEIAARTALEFFNARVAIYNAQITAFNAQIELYRARLLESQQRIEVYRGQIEAARLRGEINEQRVRIYAEQVRALLTDAEIYKAEIDGARAKAEIAATQASAFRAQVEGFGAQVAAKRAEYEAWGEQIRAEGQKTEIYRATVAAFAERVRAYASQVEAGASKLRVEGEIERLKVEQFEALSRVVTARIGADAQRLQAETSAFDGQARMYAAQVNALAEGERIKGFQYQAQIEAYRAQASINIENFRASTDSLRSSVALALEAQKAIAQVTGQLAAGAMSALNVGATIGSTGSSSDSFGTNVTYSVDGGEGSPPIASG